MNTEELISELPKGILKWYKFNKGSRALYISIGLEYDGILQDALCNEGVTVDVIDIRSAGREKLSGCCYDYVLMSGALERSDNPMELLTRARGVLNENGKLILATDNRLGIRYFCGDRDAFTDRNFDGIEGYVNFRQYGMAKLDGRAYAKDEITAMLENAGFKHHHFYSVLPSISNPQILFSEDFTPKEQLDIRIFPQYNTPETVFLNEELLYSSLIRNGMFHAMADGYFIECPLDGVFDNALQVTISMDRGRENALCTIIRNDNTVIKKPLYADGTAKVDRLLDNNRYLMEHGVNMVDAKVEDDSFVMPYIDAESATDYFRRLLIADRDLFLIEFDRFRDILASSSEHVSYGDIDWEHFDPEWDKGKTDNPNRDKWRKVAFGNENDKANLGIILKRGYVDLVPLNCFYLDGEFVFYDQELYTENVPLNTMLWRTIIFIYYGNAQMEQLLPMEELLEHYHLKEYNALWSQFTRCFLEKLKGERFLAGFYKSVRRDSLTVSANRKRMNYSADEYDRLFKDIFKDTDGKRIYLFGSGTFASKFINRFGTDYEITGIIDNNPDKWGKSLEGIGIYSPDIFSQLTDGSYKVIICIKNCNPIIRQLKKLGVRNYGVYDADMIYERKLPVKVLTVNEDNSENKKYHVGYVAGVFDLFHIGHLNMFKRAKEQCDYLIVGVVNDELVMNDKKTMPYVPFEERLEIVKSCEYVDEAVELNRYNGDTYEMYRRYQFDVQFSGSDYENNMEWLARQAYLRKHGSDMVFFPYTQSTSSTKIKAMIEKKLL